MIPPRERGSEYLMLRLRTTHGIEEWEYRREFYMNFDPIAAKLAEYEQRGWLQRTDRRWAADTGGLFTVQPSHCGGAGASGDSYPEQYAGENPFRPSP